MTENGNENGPTTEDRAKLLADHLREVRRLAAELPSLGFGVQPPPSTGVMVTARGGPEVERAANSLVAAEREVGAVKFAEMVIDRIAGIFGLEL